MTGVASMQQGRIHTASPENKRGRSQTILLRSLIFALGHFAYPDGSSGAERSFCNLAWDCIHVNHSVSFACPASRMFCWQRPQAQWQAAAEDCETNSKNVACFGFHLGRFVPRTLPKFAWAWEAPKSFAKEDFPAFGGAHSCVWKWNRAIWHGSRPIRARIRCSTFSVGEVFRASPWAKTKLCSAQTSEIQGRSWALSFRCLPRVGALQVLGCKEVEAGWNRGLAYGRLPLRATMAPFSRAKIPAPWSWWWSQRLACLACGG